VARAIFVGHQAALQALPLHQLLLAFRIEPEIKLPLRHDPARCDGVDPDVVGTETRAQRRAAYAGLAAV